MEKIIYTQENYKIGQWSGGRTREMAIYPQNAEYLDRDFMWRLSSADSDQEESSFTKLPDYDRILMVLEGNVVLAHGDERSVNLGPFEQDSFDGDVKTKCFGNLKRDYNLIMRKGCKGRMEVIDAEDKGKKIDLSERRDADYDGIGGDCASLGIYCVEGYIIVSIDGNTEMVREDQQMVIKLEPGETPDITVMGKGKGVLTEVIFEKEVIFADIPTDGAKSKSDYATALKLSLGNNKWNNIRKRAIRKGELYDAALEKKLRWLDTFMIAPAIWVIGVMICVYLFSTGGNPIAILAAIIIFTIVDIFVITPLIYMIVLPRPISAHIKNYSDLNKYEQELLEKQLDYDPRHEKLMYKYRDRSGETYKGTRDFLKKLNK